MEVINSILPSLSPSRSRYAMSIRRFDATTVVLRRRRVFSSDARKRERERDIYVYVLLSFRRVKNKLVISGRYILTDDRFEILPSNEAAGTG